MSWVWPHLGLRDMGCSHRAPCLGSLLPGDVLGADSVWAGAEGSGSLPPRSPGPLFPLPRRPALRLSSRSLARALCSSNNLIRFPRPPIEMRLTSACTRACGPSEAIPDLDLGEQGPVLVAHTLFLSQDSPQRVTEKGPPGKMLPGVTGQRGLASCGHFRSCRLGGSDPGTAWGSPLALRRIPTTRAVPSYDTPHPPRYCKLFRELLGAQEWLGEGTERGGPPPDGTAGERREG